MNPSALVKFEQHTLQCLVSNGPDFLSSSSKPLTYIRLSR
jgi:hypothetical protein